MGVFSGVIWMVVWDMNMGVDFVVVVVCGNIIIGSYNFKFFVVMDNGGLMFLQL